MYSVYILNMIMQKYSVKGRGFGRNSEGNVINIFIFIKKKFLLYTLIRCWKEDIIVFGRA